jgi:hypothetical protein
VGSEMCYKRQGVDRAKDTRQAISIIRVLFKRNKITVESVEAFIALNKELLDYIVKFVQERVSGFTSMVIIPGRQSITFAQT